MPHRLQLSGAAKQALDHNLIGYTDALGVLPLRERISTHYRDMYGIDVPVERIVITTGSSAGFILSFLACFDHGDHIGLPVPGYPAYKNITASLNIETLLLAVTAKTSWMPTIEDIRAKVDVMDGLLIASPANPTGAMMTPENLQAVIRLCDERGIQFISDEIYHGLVYSAETACALQYSDDVIVINSFSKYFCMTGWRIGWMIVPETLVQHIEYIAQNLFISPPTLSQHAAIAAFDAKDELDARKDKYAANRDYLVRELASLGLEDFYKPDGAFYLYVDVSKLTNDSVEFARNMLCEAGVAVTPGIDFDVEHGSRYIRISFAGSMSDMEKGINALHHWLG